jgi:hypothetical protein
MDPKLNQPGLAERHGMGADATLNARDTFLLLQWPALKFVLNKVAAVNHNRTMFKKEWPGLSNYKLRPNNVFELIKGSDFWQKTEEDKEIEKSTQG